MNDFDWRTDYLLNNAPKNLYVVHLGYGHLGIFVPHEIVLSTRLNP